MFSLKVDWKKRLIVGLLTIIPMLILSISFIMISISKYMVDGIVVTVICLLVFMLGVKDVLFFELNKKRRLDYFGGKEETEWKPDSVAFLIRITTFLILTLYFIIVVITRKNW